MANPEKKIPLLTYYSPSHQSLFDRYFYPSYLDHLSESFEIHILKGEQVCQSIFRKGNWNQQVKEKIVFVNEFLKSTTDDFLLFSDVDIIFYKNIKDDLLEEINNYDLVLQNDSVEGQHKTLCSGFYFCRINNETKTFFENLLNNFDDKFDDQQNINLQLDNNNNLKYKALSKKFYNLSNSPLHFWAPGFKLFFPEFPIVMYHANFTLGIDNKLFLLEKFKKWNNVSVLKHSI